MYHGASSGRSPSTSAAATRSPCRRAPRRLHLASAALGRRSGRRGDRARRHLDRDLGADHLRRRDAGVRRRRPGLLVPDRSRPGAAHHAAHEGRHPRRPVRRHARHGRDRARSPRRHGVAVIEDAAEAIGSEYKGRRPGSFGDVGVFSFHGSKTLTTGEGGMLVTDDATLYERGPGAARPRAPAGRQVVLQHRGRLQVQDDEHAGRARPGAARADRRARRRASARSSAGIASELGSDADAQRRAAGRQEHATGW